MPATSAGIKKWRTSPVFRPKLRNVLFLRPRRTGRPSRQGRPHRDFCCCWAYIPCSISSFLERRGVDESVENAAGAVLPEVRRVGVRDHAGAGGGMHAGIGEQRQLPADPSSAHQGQDGRTRPGSDVEGGDLQRVLLDRRGRRFLRCWASSRAARWPRKVRYSVHGIGNRVGVRRQPLSQEQADQFVERRQLVV